MTTQDIQKLANLARISISDTEASALSSDMDRILEYIKQIENVDISQSSKNHVVYNNTRDDISIIQPSGQRQAIIANFPKAQAEYLEVNKIINND